MDDVIVNIIALATTERVGLWAQDEGIHYRSPQPISSELRELVLANKPLLLVRLSLWDAQEAIRLEEAADGLCESLCASGGDAVINREASRCVSAHHRHDMSVVRRACALIEDRARVLWAAGTQGAAA